MSVIDDAVLLKMAEREILGEARKAAVRHSIAGVSGWQPCSKPNKTFLTNIILQAMASNKILARKKGNKSLLGQKVERKYLRATAVEKDANFLYKKPKELKRVKKKCVLNSTSSKCKMKKSKSEMKQSKSIEEVKIKHNGLNINQIKD